ncbi:MAG: hypothetical protein HYZ43_15860, partial [Flavobacteriia bacterium]|nr:hypothetical protein [Flavobacteriia bacterium]
IIELRQKSPHLSANLLKLYLRELPDPLFRQLNRLQSIVQSHR